ncbi:uncharacterized protein LOC128042994 [Gossypium raimondii]|uniref:uncharacterized protein LOC128042994 n=1 Tax=Gossypium raimondii TaxID=29730 RepID=UPI00227B8AEF|nr:uncharacterized protein LOC128042994 [Gossypium raimondii]
MRDFAAQSEARAPAHTYAIQAREEATASNVIAGTFFLFDTIVYALIDPGSMHSYIYTALVTKKKRPIEFTDYDIQVTNPLGQTCEFPADLMLIDLKCQTGEMITVESENSKEIVRIISALSAQKLMQKGLSPDCEVEFIIDVIPKITPISITPYRMTLAELKELKT